jgi:hypothetical protein
MMYLHPNQYLWMAEQDRDRAMAQRALERAARSGGEDHPGAVRGGLTSLATIIRRAAAATTQIRVGGSTPTAPLSGSAAG